MLRAALGLEGSAAAFGARLRLNRIQLIGLLQKADRLPRASQKLIIDTRPDRRHGPIWNAFNIVARLNQNRIDPFEPGAFQRPLRHLIGRKYGSHARSRPKKSSRLDEPGAWTSALAHAVNKIDGFLECRIHQLSCLCVALSLGRLLSIADSGGAELTFGDLLALCSGTHRRFAIIPPTGERDNGASVP